MKHSAEASQVEVKIVFFQQQPDQTMIKTFLGQNRQQSLSVSMMRIKGNVSQKTCRTTSTALCRKKKIHRRCRSIRDETDSLSWAVQRWTSLIAPPAVHAWIQFHLPRRNKISSRGQAFLTLHFEWGYENNGEWHTHISYFCARPRQHLYMHH